MIAVDEDEGTVAKSSSRERIHNRDDIAVVYVLPFLDRSDSSLVAQTKS